MKLIKVQVTQENRSGNQSTSNSYEAVYLVRGLFKKRMYYITQNYALPVMNLAEPVEEDKPDLDTSDVEAEHNMEAAVEQAEAAHDAQREDGEV